MLHQFKIKSGMLDDFITLSIGGDNELLEITESIMIKILKSTLNDNTTYLFNSFIIAQPYSLMLLLF